MTCSGPSTRPTSLQIVSARPRDNAGRASAAGCPRSSTATRADRPSPTRRRHTARAAGSPTGPPPGARRQNSAASAWPRPVELARLRLVQVPEQVGADRVQAHGPGHLQAMPPVFPGTRGAWISPQRIWNGFPSSRKSFVPMGKLCVGEPGSRSTAFRKHRLQRRQQLPGFEGSVKGFIFLGRPENRCLSLAVTSGRAIARRAFLPRRIPAEARRSASPPDGGNPPVSRENEEPRIPRPAPATQTCFAHQMFYLRPATARISQRAIRAKDIVRNCAVGLVGGPSGRRRTLSGSIYPGA